MREKTVQKKKKGFLYRKWRKQDHTNRYFSNRRFCSTANTVEHNLSNSEGKPDAKILDPNIIPQER